MRALATCLLMAACAVPAAFAQNAAPATPPCDGTILNLRVSTITPGGSIEKFAAAVAAQKAWYKSHGLPDQIFMSKILVRDPETRSSHYSDTEAISYHFYAPGNATMPPHDAAWDEFVKMFAETSTVKETTLTCVAKEMIPMKM